MTTKRRRQFTANFKKRVALEALRDRRNPRRQQYRANRVGHRRHGPDRHAGIQLANRAARRVRRHAAEVKRHPRAVHVLRGPEDDGNGAVCTGNETKWPSSTTPTTVDHAGSRPRRDRPTRLPTAS